MNYELLKKKITTALTLNCKVGEYYNAKKGKKMNFYIAPDNIDSIIPVINSIISSNNSLAVIKSAVGSLILDIDFSKAKGFHFSSKLKDKVIIVKDVIDLDKIIASCNDVKIVKKENNTTKKVVDSRYYCLYLSETNTGVKDIVFVKVGKFPTIYIANENVIVKKVIIPRKEFKTYDLLRDYIKEEYKKNGVDVNTVVILNNKKEVKKDNNSIKASHSKDRSKNLDNTKKEIRRKTTNKPVETLSKEQSSKTNDNKHEPKWNILYIFDSNRNAMVYYGTKKLSIKGKGTLKTLPIAFTEEELLRYIEDYLKENKIVHRIIKNMDKEK